MSRKSVILFLICCLAAFASIMMYFLSADKAEKAVPAVITLSSEQLMGLGYTDPTTADTYGIWEDDDFSYSKKASEKETSSVSAASFPLDLNTATEEELIQINGIGPATAEKIISYRTSHGFFYSVDELINVDGIGNKKLSEMENYVYVDPEITSETPEASETTIPPESSADNSSESETETVTIPRIPDEFSEAQNIPEAETIFPIELNTASAEELMEINGIGEVIAGAIVEYARSVGFSSINDLMNVPGIGEKRFENISPYVYVENAVSNIAENISR